jgi:large subunit ribosomal protein L22
MQATAHLNDVRLSPQKARLVARLVKRGMHVSHALIVLSEMPQRGAYYIRKCLNSAIANFENNLHGDIDDLFIESICVNQGPTFKRVSPRAKGRADHIKKPTSHISVVVADSSVHSKERD